MSKIVELPTDILFDNEKELPEQSQAAKKWIDEAYKEGKKIGIGWGPDLKPYYTEIEHKGKKLKIDKPGKIKIEEDGTQL